MAATVSLIQMLAAGVANTDGTPVASGRCRFYQPGTLTPVTVYADSAGATAITPPLILTAGGTGTAYTQQPTRLIVKDATDTNTLFDGNVNTDRGESEYIASAAWNGGTETRLQTILDNFSTAWGGSAGYWQYKAYSDAVERNPKDVISEILVSVKTYGATGDGITDDTTAIQASSTRVAANGGGTVYIPPGTYLTSAAITAAAGVNFRGAGSTVSIIKASGAAQNAITFTGAGASAINNRVSDIGFTHLTTTTGSAISGASIGVDSINVTADKYRFGITATDGALWTVSYSTINGTAADASSIPVRVTGSTFVMIGCLVRNAGAGQAAVQLGTSLTSLVIGNIILGTGSGITVTSTGLFSAMGNSISGATNGIIIGASVTGALIAPGQLISPDVVDNRAATTAPVGYSFAVNGNFTPLPSQTDAIRAVGTAGGITITVNAIAATGFGRRWSLICSNTSGGAVTWTFNAQYVLSAAVAPATGNRVNLLLEYNPVDNKVYEIGRAATAN